MSLVSAVATLCLGVFSVAFGFACLTRPESVLRFEARIRYTNPSEMDPHKSQVAVAKVAGGALLLMGGFVVIFGLGML